MTSRMRFLLDLASIVPKPDGSPVRVGIDGPDGAGKTTLRKELAALLRKQGRAVVEASLDDFHNPREYRYRQGRTSARGYWEDAFDREAFVKKVLAPLGPGGDRAIRLRHHNLATDQLLPDAPGCVVGNDVTLVADGVFLQHPALAPYWDGVLYLDVPFEETFARMAYRDGSPSDPFAPQNERYREAQLIYQHEVDPRAHADIIVDNTNPADPWVLTRVA